MYPESTFIEWSWWTCDITNDITWTVFINQKTAKDKMTPNWNCCMKVLHSEASSTEIWIFPDLVRDYLTIWFSTLIPNLNGKTKLFTTTVCMKVKHRLTELFPGWGKQHFIKGPVSATRFTSQLFWGYMKNLFYYMAFLDLDFQELFWYNFSFLLFFLI